MVPPFGGCWLAAAPLRAAPKSDLLRCCCVAARVALRRLDGASSSKACDSRAASCCRVPQVERCRDLSCSRSAGMVDIRSSMRTTLEQARVVPLQPHEIYIKPADVR